ncbi:MAG: hypothetical protein M0R80_01105 [Proteobacteria bacterium]|jgi:hypothetical protein|nr:hypothetical protein [Pseudomonadota bacterium]
MDQKQLFIPEKIKVGFQNREGTYTKKLAYVIYYDQKGVLRKEKSWQSWRDKKIDPIECSNVPTEGFVLNKGVGGARHSYGWNARNEYIRVYDPRDFEFEISVANLLFILRECDCSRGKGLEGKFVFAWDGTELVLLPACSQDYKNSQNFTELQGQGVKAKDLIPGASYTTKKQGVLIYLGKFDCHYTVELDHKGFPSNKTPLKKWVFVKVGKEDFVLLDNVKSLAVCNSSTPVPNYAELMDKFAKSIYGSKVARLFTKEYAPKPRKNYWDYDFWFAKLPNEEYVECATHYKYDDPTKVDYVETRERVFLKDGVLHHEWNSRYTYRPGDQRRCGSESWIEPTNLHLYVELESGSQFRFSERRLLQEGEADG